VNDSARPLEQRRQDAQRLFLNGDAQAAPAELTIAYVQFERAEGDDGH